MNREEFKTAVREGCSAKGYAFGTVVDDKEHDCLEFRIIRTDQAYPSYFAVGYDMIATARDGFVDFVVSELCKNEVG